MKTTSIFLAGCIALAFSPVSKSHLFKFKLDPGKVYSQTTSITTDTKQSFQGQEMTIHQFVSVNTSLEYSEAKNDTMDNYKMWYNDIKMEVNGMGQDQKFGSDTTKLTTTDATSRILNQLVDKKFNTDFSHRGLVIEVFGLEEIIDEATISATGVTAMYAEQFSGGFGDNGLAKNLEMVTAIWPDHEVAVGDSWTNTQYTTTGLPILVSNTYTLESADKKSGKIAVKSELVIDKENNSTMVSGMEAAYYLEGSRTGTIEFEPHSGWVTNATLLDEIVGNIVISPSEQVPDGMTIPVEFKNDVLVKSN